MGPLTAGFPLAPGSAARAARWSLVLLTLGASAGATRPARAASPARGPSIAVPTLAWQADAAGRLRVTRVYKDGRDERRVVDPRKVPPGRDLTSWVQGVSDQLQADGFTRQPGRAPDGHQVWVFTRKAPTVARLTVTVSVPGKAEVTRTLDLDVTLEKPAGWSEVQAWFAPGLSVDRRSRIKRDFDGDVEAAVQHLIAAAASRPPRLSEAEKQRLRRPEAAEVKVEREVGLPQGDRGAIRARVRSKTVNRSLGVN